MTVLQNKKQKWETRTKYHLFCQGTEKGTAWEGEGPFFFGVSDRSAVLLSCSPAALVSLGMKDARVPLGDLHSKFGLLHCFFFFFVFQPFPSIFVFVSVWMVGAMVHLTFVY